MYMLKNFLNLFWTCSSAAGDEHDAPTVIEVAHKELRASEDNSSAKVK